ncbi:MAG: NADP-dependent oxidoreductase [Rhodospirillales bacterium]|nr:NADP-dependent oxidoreductase [Rhodospirillales bacterium]
MSDAADAISRALVLRRRPNGLPGPHDFEWRETPLPAPGPGEVLTRTLFLSIDPYMRGRLSDRPSYAPSVGIGEVMTGECVGRVIASADPGFAPGDVVLGTRGWQTHALAKAKNLVKLPPSGPGVAPYSAYLGVLGMPGTTAYSGMKDIGRPQAGETVVISAAAGAVGSVAGQLAKRAGARVVGIAGGSAKCLYVQEELGFDACIDHRADDLDAALAETCPKGVDVYFENVGGAVQRAVFAALAPFARVVMCGMVAQYNDASFADGPNLGFVVGKRVTIQGMIVSDKPERFAEWRSLASPWVADGSLAWREDMHDGLESAPAALAAVLRGGNFGKCVVRVARE